MELYKNESIKEYPGFEGYYAATTLGRIFGLPRKGRPEVKEITQSLNDSGYMYVRITKDGIQKHMYVHRIVALTFIPNPKNLPQVNHIDFVKLNNNMDNLEWCTQKQNNNHFLIAATKAKTIFNFSDWAEKITTESRREYEDWE